jgi:hypothetical protein
VQGQDKPGSNDPGCPATRTGRPLDAVTTDQVRLPGTDKFLVPDEQPEYLGHRQHIQTDYKNNCAFDDKKWKNYILLNRAQLIKSDDTTNIHSGQGPISCIGPRDWYGLS